MECHRRAPALAGLALSIVTSFTQAVEIRFDDADLNLSPTLTIALDGLTLQVGCEVPTSTADCELTQTEEGLGVRSGGSDSPQLDGSGPDEAITLRASGMFQLLGIDLDRIDTNDDLRFSVDNRLLFEGAIADTQDHPLLQITCIPELDDDTPANECEVRFDSPVSGLQVSIGVANANDDFRLESVLLGVSDAVDAVAVTEPGTLGLLATVLCGLFYRRRCSLGNK